MSLISMVLSVGYKIRLQNSHCVHFQTKCLRRITTGLAQYRGQMQYVQEESKSTLCDGIMYRISRLQKLVEDMVGLL